MNKIRLLLSLLLSVLPVLVVFPLAQAAQVRLQTMSTTIPSDCTTPPAVTTFQPTDQQAVLYFVLDYCSAGDQVTANWRKPDWSIYLSDSWNPLGSSGSYCFWDWIWVANNPPAAIPGNWIVEVLLNGRSLFTTRFIIADPPSSGNVAPSITGINPSQIIPGSVYVSVSGIGFQSGAVVNVDYAPNGRLDHRVGTVSGQVYNSAQLSVWLFLRDPGEFELSVQNPNGAVSRPRMLFVGLGGHKLPYQGGESWYCTQGNNETCGQCDHYGRPAYAYDFSAGANHCVVAMKAGWVHTNDNHIPGYSASQPYGNYVTVDTGDGYFDHYGHLTTGTFVVKDGQYVEQGQALATVGNSGHSSGYHVHVHVTKTDDIYAQSVPFLFDDVSSPEGSTPGQPTSEGRPPYTSYNYSPLGSCGSSTGNMSPDQQAKADMEHYMSQHTPYGGNPIESTLVTYKNYWQGFDLREMQFGYLFNGNQNYLSVYHATYTLNPRERWVAYTDPFGNFQGWFPVGQ